MVHLFFNWLCKKRLTGGCWRVIQTFSQSVKRKESEKAGPVTGVRWTLVPSLFVRTGQRHALVTLATSWAWMLQRFAFRPTINCWKAGTRLEIKRSELAGTVTDSVSGTRYAKTNTFINQLFQDITSVIVNGVNSNRTVMEVACNLFFKEQNKIINQK